MTPTPREPENTSASTRAQTGGVPDELSPKQQKRLYWLGVGAACAVALIYGACTAAIVTGYLLPHVFDELDEAFKNRGVAANFGWLTFFSLPVVMGALAAWIWRPLKLTERGLAFGACTVATCSILSAGFLLGGAMILLIMAWPLIWLIVALGCFLGNWIARLDAKGGL